MGARSEEVSITVAEADDATGWINPRQGLLGVTISGAGTYSVDLETRFNGATALKVYDKTSTQLQYSDDINAVIECSGDPGQEYRLVCTSVDSGTPYLRLGYGV